MSYNSVTSSLGPEHNCKFLYEEFRENKWRERKVVLLNAEYEDISQTRLSTSSILSHVQQAINAKEPTQSPTRAYKRIFNECLESLHPSWKRILGAVTCFFGDDPPRKKEVYDYLLNNLIHELSLPTPCLSQKELLAHLYRSYGIESPPREGSLSMELAKALGFLFNLSDDPMLQEPSARRFYLFEALEKAHDSQEYQIQFPLYCRASQKERKNYPRLQILLHLSQLLFQVPMWDLLKTITEEAILLGQNASMKKIDHFLDLRQAVEEEFQAIANVPPSNRPPSLGVLLEKSKAYVSFMQFAPLSGTNFASHLFYERYQKGDEILELSVLRFPTPTHDGWLGSEKALLGVFRLKLDHLLAEGKTHCFFSHQKMDTIAQWWDATEGKRTSELIQASCLRPDHFFVFSLPLDGPAIYKEEGRSLDVKSFFEETLGIMLEGSDSSRRKEEGFKNNRYGFYFPIDPLRTKFGKRYDLKQDLLTCMEEIYKNFFNGILTFDSDKQQIFLLMLYTKIEQFFAVKLKASRNSTCKDAIDRAAVINALSYLLSLSYLGKLHDPHHLLNLRVLLHHAAFIVKGTPVQPERAGLFINTLRFIEERVDTPTKSENEGWQLIEICPQI